MSDSRPGRFSPGEKAAGTHWVRDWVGPRSGLDEVENRKFLALPGLELRPFGSPASRQSQCRLRYLSPFKHMMGIKISIHVSNHLSSYVATRIHRKLGKA